MNYPCDAASNPTSLGQEIIRSTRKKGSSSELHQNLYKPEVDGQDTGKRKTTLRDRVVLWRAPACVVPCPTATGS